MSQATRAGYSGEVNGPATFTRGLARFAPAVSAGLPPLSGARHNQRPNAGFRRAHSPPMEMPLASTLDVPAGQFVFREGEAGQAMFIVESGAIELLIAARGAEPVAVLGPGEFFGEMAMLTDLPRFTSARARGTARLLRIERTELSDLLRQNAAIGECMLRMLSARHRNSEQRLTEAMAEIARLRGPAAKPAAAPKPAKAPPPAAVEAPAPTSIGVEAAAPAAPVPPSSERCLLRHAGGESFPLDPAVAEFLIGRPDPAAGIRPEIDLSGLDATRSLSRRHAKLVRQGRLYFVREETSTVNGTFVNGTRVTTGNDVPIKPGDTLRFGAVEVLFTAA